MDYATIYKSYGVRIILFIIALMAVLTWVFYEYAVLPHIGDTTGINTWGKVLLVYASLMIVENIMAVVASVGLPFLIK